jgi:hypothetical protein
MLSRLFGYAAIAEGEPASSPEPMGLYLSVPDPKFKPWYPLKSLVSDVSRLRRRTSLGTHYSSARLTTGFICERKN